jgi:hypothetical protein
MQSSSRTAVLQSVLTALSLAQALAWQRAVDLLLSRLLPSSQYGPTSAIVVAVLTTATCLMGTWVAIGAFGVIDDLPAIEFALVTTPPIGASSGAPRATTGDARRRT